MDINDFRSISTVLCFIALAAVFYWTYDPKRKKVYDEAALLPFAEDELPASTDNVGLNQNKKSDEEHS